VFQRPTLVRRLQAAPSSQNQQGHHRETDCLPDRWRSPVWRNKRGQEKTERQLCGRYGPALPAPQEIGAARGCDRQYQARKVMPRRDNADDREESGNGMPDLCKTG
jgi:hypothetical protein